MDGPIEPNLTIISCSSGNSSDSAISIVRLSGSFELSVFDKVLGSSIINAQPRKMYRADLKFDDVIVDDILFTYFSAPNSYTGENTLEVYCHGNRYNVDRIIKLFIENFSFIRHANPGEFTLRALKNKKMSLSQVEGLDLLINAQHSYAFSHGLSLLNGELSKQYKNLYDNYLDLRVKLELLMDFSEDVGEEEGLELFKVSFGRFKSCVLNLNSRCETNSDELLSPKVTLFGPVNSGKSTFFNQLLNTNRSIISPQEGTTRDYVSEYFDTGELKCKLLDTAGIRDAENDVEKEGIRRSFDLVKGSFYKICLINVNKYEEYIEKAAIFDADLVILTHLDTIRNLDHFEIKLIPNLEYLFLCPSEDFSEYTRGLCISYDKEVSVNPIKYLNNGTVNIDIVNELKSGPIEPVKSGPIEPAESGPIEPVKSGPIEPVKSGPIEPVKSGPIEPMKKVDLEIGSIINKKSLNTSSDLVKLLKSHIGFKYSRIFKNEPILLNRHKVKLHEISLYVAQISDILNNESDLGIITNLLENLENSLEELIGIVNSDTVLDNVFSNFCIGK